MDATTRIKLTLGDLIVQNASLQENLEKAIARNAELAKELEALKPKTENVS